MDEKGKIIRDPIHGNINLGGVFVDLLETPEIQHLYNIKQLGLAHLVFPGAHHTRLEHSLGAYNIAFEACDKLGLNEEETQIVCSAALLHDIGHGPFSHTLESILRKSLNIDHVGLTEKLIFGEYEIFNPKEKEYIDSPSVSSILDGNQIDKEKVVKIIKGEIFEKPYLSQLLNSSIDIDQLDYLIRDAYYTGVAYGMIDIQRFLQTLLISDGRLAVDKKGVSVVENILMARALMYSSVYFHKTVRIAELMLSKAIELMDNAQPFEFFKMTDAELMNELKQMGPYQHEIATRIKYRKLFKQVYSASASVLDEEENRIVKGLEDIKLRNTKERELEEKLKIPRGHIIIDVPYLELHQSEPRIDQTDIGILDDSQLKSLDEFTPIAKAVRSRQTTDWSIMVITDEKYREIVSNNAAKLIFN